MIILHPDCLCPFLSYLFSPALLFPVWMDDAIIKGDLFLILLLRFPEYDFAAYILRHSLLPIFLQQWLGPTCLCMYCYIPGGGLVFKHLAHLGVVRPSWPKWVPLLANEHAMPLHELLPKSIPIMLFDTHHNLRYPAPIFKRDSACNAIYINQSDINIHISQRGPQASTGLMHASIRARQVSTND